MNKEQDYEQGVKDGLGIALQLIKELRPAIKPLEGMGKSKSTEAWFDILVKQVEEMKQQMNRDFTSAPVKGEGMLVDFDGTGVAPAKPKVETTYVERRIPEHLEFKAHRLLDTLLVEHGYNPKEL